jgi:hypothetical protein
MQQMLQNLQFQYRIYNPEIEPEHDTDYPCSCPIHQYQYTKWNRLRVQEMWSKAVMYPGKSTSIIVVPGNLHLSLGNTHSLINRGEVVQ